jgi:putative flavoprotein involved in K+ transport
MSVERSREEVDAVVVGGGQAGVMLSHYLSLRGITHVVLERDRAFSAWRNRWEGFQTNTPNWMNTLPVLPADRFPSDDPLAFGTRDEMVAYFDECLAAVAPPLLTDTNVERILSLDSGIWEVDTDGGGYRATSVALCNGAMSRPNVPVAAAEIVDSVTQIHSSEYRQPEQIETGSVLVVGSASSGVQICRLLGESGRFDQLHMSVSHVTVLPKRILGVQTHRFIHALGLFDVRSRSRLGRLMYSDLERKGDPIMRPTPGDLSKVHGIRLFSKFEGVEGSTLTFTDGQSLSTDDLTIIWCTGFKGDYSTLAETKDVLNSDGSPVHLRGVANASPGLFFVGLRHQHTVASHDIYGVAKDAEFVADRIRDRLVRLGSATAPDDRGVARS